MKDLLDNYKKLLNEIRVITGSNYLSFPIEIDLKSPWAIYKWNLILFPEEAKIERSLSDEDFWLYTISSETSKNEKFYYGEKETMTFVMAYPSDESWQNTTIFILNNNKKISNETVAIYF